MAQCGVVPDSVWCGTVWCQSRCGVVQCGASLGVVQCGVVQVSGAKQALAWNLDELPLQAVLGRTPISERDCMSAGGDADSF